MFKEDQFSTPHWFVIHTNPRQEDRADQNLRSWNIETLNPKFRERRKNLYGGPAIYVSKPLFPRYIFARFKLQEFFHKVRFTRGVYRIVTFGDYPTAVDDCIINIIKSRTDKMGFIRLERNLKEGDEVKIIEGPLRGFLGVFEYDLKESDRAMILLKTVSYQAHMEVSKRQVMKVPTVL